MRGGELGRGAIAKHAVRSMFVVVAPPGRDDGTSGVQRYEPMVVQALVPELAIEALDEGILRRAARRDELQVHAVAIRPLIERAAGELRPLVGANSGGQTTKPRGLVEHSRHI